MVNVAITEEHPLDDPLTVVSKHLASGTGVSFTRNLLWEAGPVPGRRVRITKEEATRFAAVQAGRVRGEPTYRHFALVSERRPTVDDPAWIQRAAEWRRKSVGTSAYFAITSGGRTVDDPLTVVRVFTPQESEPVEERYGDFGWAATDLRRDVADHEVVPITGSRFERFSILWYQRQRGRQA